LEFSSNSNYFLDLKKIKNKIKNDYGIACIFLLGRKTILIIIITTYSKPPKNGYQFKI